MSNGDHKNGATRLDSWKAIAAYLDRDERTVQRWERSLGLPVRRLPGGRGRSVFAYASEIDAWLQTTPASERGSEELNVPERTPSPAPSRRLVWPRRVGAAAAMVAIVVAGRTWWPAGAIDLSLLRVRLTPSSVAATMGDAPQWEYVFPDGERITIPDERRAEPAVVLAGADPSVLVATSLRVSSADESVRGGELLWFSPAGDLRRRASLEDRVRFGADEYGVPWGITDFRVRPGEAGGLAVAAHHVRWWPSMAVRLDDGGRRIGTFVNAGWLERVHWLTDERLVVAGFSESKNGGMVGLLDAGAMNGQSPEAPGSRFFCTSCGSDRPLRYVVMPRSEINLRSGSRFNRARLQVEEGRIVARTIEMVSGEIEAADAIYEFTPELRLVRAHFSERYWDMHAALEARGQIAHSRDNCPDRFGPREIQVWEPGAGWQTVRANAP